MDNRIWTSIAVVFALVLALGWFAQSALIAPTSQTTWSDLKALVEKGEIEQVTFDGQLVRAERKGADKPQDIVSVVRVDGDESFISLLEAKGVRYRATPPARIDGSLLLLAILPLGMLVFFWVVLNRQNAAGGRSVQAFGRAGASVVPEEGTGVTFADVAGAEEAVEELEEVVAFLKTPERFTALGGKPPKGVLLVGPPGTGKTLLARAVAGEAGVPFFSISGSAFVEMFVGVGAARVRDLFKSALENAPCILFIDELDAVGKARGAGGPAGNEEREQTLNQLLVEMDGFDNRTGIIVMAATNRPEILDAALLRAGRFDRQVLVDRPDLRGRIRILEVHGKRLTLDPSVNFETIAKMTPGLAGADLANILNEAALLAARRDKKAIDASDVSEAIERVIAGLEKKTRRMNEREKRMTAFHECGHALCAAASPGADPVQKISIIPRGMALGYTMYVPAEDRYSSTKSQLLTRITTLYGGRAAEAIVFGDVTTGASDDIRRATDIARAMVTEYGMSKKLGAVRYAPRSESPFGFGMMGEPSAGSPETAEVIEAEIRAILDLCHTRALDILIQNRGLLEEMSAHLFENEVLEGDVMNAFLARAAQADSLEDRPTAEWVPEELLE